MDSSKTSNDRVSGILAQYADYLRFRKSIGLDFLLCSRSSAPAAAETVAADVERPAEMVQPSPGVQSFCLEDVFQEMGDCKRCGLHRTRTHLVFGAGDRNAELVFVGEGPGQEEDLQGEPFVGAAGQLLNRIIAAIDLKREDVYICNVVKCRPPGNRTPERDEIEKCKPFLLKQLEIIQPKLICTLGSVAARALLGLAKPLSTLRGRFYDFNGAKLMPTYHPAYLLRNPSKKRDVWTDMQMVQQEYAKGLLRNKLAF
ncbi:MAG: uracil-DNA glycosylase [Pseudomonadota bacterium]